MVLLVVVRFHLLMAFIIFFVESLRENRMGLRPCVWGRMRLSSLIVVIFAVNVLMVVFMYLTVVFVYFIRCLFVFVFWFCCKRVIGLYIVVLGYWVLNIWLKLGVWLWSYTTWWGSFLCPTIEVGLIWLRCVSLTLVSGVIILVVMFLIVILVM